MSLNVYGQDMAKLIDIIFLIVRLLMILYVLQFYSSSLSKYRHSVIVVLQTDYGVSDHTKVKVSQHSVLTRWYLC